MSAFLLASCALAFVGSPLAARHTGAARCVPCACRTAGAQVRMGPDGREQPDTSRRLGITHSPRLAALASTRKKQKSETVAPSRQLFAFDTTGMSKGDIIKCQIIGGVGAAMVVNRVVFGGGSKPNEPETLKPQFTAKDEKTIKMLKAFKCENCGYELYPARGREGKFFPDTFKCPMCKSPKESFYDMNDEDDPRNWEEDEDEDEEGDGGGGSAAE